MKIAILAGGIDDDAADTWRARALERPALFAEKPVRGGRCGLEHARQRRSTAAAAAGRPVD